MTLAERYGPWALIADGSEGIGASFAHQLAAAGINLVLVARKTGPLEAMRDAVVAAQGGGHYGARTGTADESPDRVNDSLLA